MLAAAKDGIEFSSMAIAQMDLLSDAEKREVLSRLNAVKSGKLRNSAIGAHGNRKINAGRFTVVYQILDGNVEVQILFARE